MKRRLLNRLLDAGVLLITIWLLNFALLHVSPGDPANRYFGPKTKAEDLRKLRDQMGLTQPWHVQLRTWTLNFFKGDLGYSWAKHRPVVEILKEAIPATLQLTFSALLVNFVLGGFIGILTGIYARNWFGQLLDFGSLSLYCIPSFWLSLVFILLFSLKLQWLPASGMTSVFIEEPGFFAEFGDRLRHAILPTAVLGLTGAAAISRYVHGHVRQILEQEYVRLAIAKGLPSQRIYIRHVFRNALIPLVTLLGVYFPILLSGAMVVEIVFAWPGMGRVTYEAIFAKDFPVIMSVNFMAAALVIAGNLLSDLIYPLVDARVYIE